MKISKFDLVSIFIIILMFSLAVYTYPNLPDEIPTHWNMAGQVDDYSSRETVFLIPIMAMLIYLLFLTLPKIAVFKENLKQFKHYDSMKLVLTLFFTFIFVATISPTWASEINMIKFITPSIGFLFMYLGYILPTVKRNFFIGIRTPWTLSSDYVWEKTHRFGGKLFFIMGLLMFTMFFLGNAYLTQFILAFIIIGVFILLFYSYFIWRKAPGKKNL